MSEMTTPVTLDLAKLPVDSFAQSQRGKLSQELQGSNSLANESYNPFFVLFPLGGSFVRAFTQGLSASLSVPYFPCASPVSGGPGASGDQSHLFPTAARNPNKAIITIDAQSSRILVANEMTCELFGYQRNELSGMKIQHLFTEPYRGKQRALMEQNISASGETVLISGKVVRVEYSKFIQLISRLRSQSIF